MATAREYFEKSLHHTLSLEWNFEIEGEPPFVVPVQIAYDFEAGGKYLRIYIPETAAPEAVLATVLNQQDQIWQADREVVSQLGIAGSDEFVSNAELRFTGRVIVWTPTAIGKERWKIMSEDLARLGITAVIRDAEFVALRDKYDAPRAFISHDSRDKKDFVAGLATKLSSSLCPVWYDEFSLKAGDSLRGSIEKGLRECPKCILVLSKNFLSNPGWTKREFETIYTREIVEGKRLVIPIWLGVSKQEFYDYSPILLDTKGINADVGVDEVARQLMAVLNYEPPSAPSS